MKGYYNCTYDRAHGSPKTLEYHPRHHLLITRICILLATPPSQVRRSSRLRKPAPRTTSSPASPAASIAALLHPQDASGPPPTACERASPPDVSSVGGATMNTTTGPEVTCPLRPGNTTAHSISSATHRHRPRHPSTRPPPHHRPRPLPRHSAPFPSSLPNPSSLTSLFIALESIPFQRQAFQRHYPIACIRRIGRNGETAYPSVTHHLGTCAQSRLRPWFCLDASARGPTAAHVSGQPM
ncbi:hypothetical protein BD626DRAFT_171424 [Schizophyllum amplum]|uniref:Uncharacterized protein n=1 Tax=Schizophyllum amplum TaxID=97359 RepID=A0A550CR58_9AGAR|nr:hypothetical protein BD626DRAFT_171424 [Auriculariopsis ampla]